MARFQNRTPTAEPLPGLTEDCRTMPVTLTRDFQRELGGTQCNPSTFPAEVIIDLP